MRAAGEARPVCASPSRDSVHLVGGLTTASTLLGGSRQPTSGVDEALESGRVWQPADPAEGLGVLAMSFEKANWGAIQSTYEAVREGVTTRLAALAFGFLVGFLFMQVFQGNAPTLTTFAAGTGVLIGAVMTVAVDALSTESGKRLHTALYIIGVVVGAMLMFVLIQQNIVEPLVAAPSS
jgi:hypothetical protein